MSPALCPVIGPERIREAWPHIRDNVSRLVAELEEPCLPEDVYLELMQPGTYLWTTGAFHGFMILQVLVNPYSRKLHVWLACNVAGDWDSDLFEQLKSIAREANCDTITFASDRTGWKRKLRGVRATTLYSFELGGSNG